MRGEFNWVLLYHRKIAMCRSATTKWGSSMRIWIWSWRMRASILLDARVPSSKSTSTPFRTRFGKNFQAWPLTQRHSKSKRLMVRAYFQEASMCTTCTDYAKVKSINTSFFQLLEARATSLARVVSARGFLSFRAWILSSSYRSLTWISFDVLEWITSSHTKFGERKTDSSALWTVIAICWRGRISRGNCFTLSLKKNNWKDTRSTTPTKKTQRILEASIISKTSL